LFQQRCGQLGLPRHCKHSIARFNKSPRGSTDACRCFEARMLIGKTRYWYSSSMANFCSNCGSDSVNGASFCPACGTPTDGHTAPTESLKSSLEKTSKLLKDAAQKKATDVLKNIDAQAGGEGSQATLSKIAKSLKRGPFKNWDSWTKKRKILVSVAGFALLVSLFNGLTGSSGDLPAGVPAAQGNAQAYNAGWNFIASIGGGLGMAPPSASDCPSSWDATTGYDEGDWVQGCMDASNAQDAAEAGGNTSATIPNK